MRMRTTATYLTRTRGTTISWMGRLRRLILARMHNLIIQMEERETDITLMDVLILQLRDSPVSLWTSLELYTSERVTTTVPATTRRASRSCYERLTRMRNSPIRAASAMTHCSRP